MKLLGLRVCEHDSNFSYFDGEQLHYLKTERKYKIKHHGVVDVLKFTANNRNLAHQECQQALSNWENVIKDQWGITSKDLDEIAIVFDPWPYNLNTRNEEFFPAIENYSDFPADCKVTRVNHHYAHYLSCWPDIDMTKNPLGIIIDGFGDFGTAWTVFKNNKLIEKGSVSSHGSLGQEMNRASTFFDFKCHSLDRPGILMALQSYGKMHKEFYDFIKQFDIYSINKLFNPIFWSGEIRDNKDWIHTIHHHVTNILLNFFTKYSSSPSDQICYAGGVALNVVWNAALKKKFKNLYIPPHTNDEGLSLGAIEYLRRKHNLRKFILPNYPFCQSDEAPPKEPSANTISKVAELLKEQKIIGWYQGNGELGPRALGNRSILADPRDNNMRDKVNEIKKRQFYRPFGCSTINPNFIESPYMLLAEPLRDNKYPAVSHVDQTCRHHTPNNNPLLKKLLINFKNQSGCDTLLNTSLNINGKPLASGLDDALELFKGCSMDGLVYGDNLYLKDD